MEAPLFQGKRYQQKDSKQVINSLKSQKINELQRTAVSECMENTENQNIDDLESSKIDKLGQQIQTLQSCILYNQQYKKLSPQLTIFEQLYYHHQQQKISITYPIYYKQSIPLTLQLTSQLQPYLLLETIQTQCPQVLPSIIHFYQSQPTSQQIQTTQNYIQSHKQKIQDLQRFMKHKFSGQNQMKLQAKEEFDFKNLAIPLILSKNYLEERFKGSFVRFSQSQDIITAMTVKNLHGAFQNIVKFSYKIQQTSEYNFQAFLRSQDSKLTKNFISQQKYLLAKLFKVDQRAVSIFSLTKGSIIVEASVTTMYFEHLLNEKIGFTQLFKNFNLSQDCFDKNEIYIFQNQWKNEQYLEIRGSFPYYPPISCIKFGLNVKNKYGNTREANEWLGCLRKQKKQWASAFHGSKIFMQIPNKSTNNQVAPQPRNFIITSMLQGFKKNEMLIIGHRQAFHNVLNQRYPGTQTRIRIGVYFTPDYEMAAIQYGTTLPEAPKDTQSNSSVNKSPETVYRDSKQKYGENNYHQKFCSVIQCRLHPRHIELGLQNHHNIWVMANLQHIRPYAILIGLKEDNQNVKQYFEKMRNQKVEQYKKYQKTFRFFYHEWKDDIKKHCQNFRE